MGFENRSLFYHLQFMRPGGYSVTLCDKALSYTVCLSACLYQEFIPVILGLRSLMSCEMTPRSAIL